MSYEVINYSNGMYLTCIDNMGHKERPNYGTFTVRKNSLGLADTRQDYKIEDTVEGRRRAKAALESGFHVFDVWGNPLTIDELTELE